VVRRDRLHDPGRPTDGAEEDEIAVLDTPPALDDVRQAGAHADDLTDGRAHLVDHVGRMRAEPAASGLRVRPPVGHLARGVGEQRDVHQERGEARVSDRSGADKLRKQCLSGAEAHLGAEDWTTPAASAAASSSRASAASRVNGFSHSTCLPAAITWCAMATCVCGGVAIVTASTPARSSTSGIEVHA
jgi:hypothetical protein